MSPNAWRTVVDITLNGTFFCSREFGRRHLEAGTPGSIVNVGASYAWTGGPGFAHSAAAKAGVKNMVETLAVEWAPYGIQVNGLVPGLFPHEDMTADIKGNLDRTNEKNLAQPALRVGQLREALQSDALALSGVARRAGKIVRASAPMKQQFADPVGLDLLRVAERSLELQPGGFRRDIGGESRQVRHAIGIGGRMARKRLRAEPL